MGYYYSGDVRKRFVSQTQLQIIANKKAERLQHIKNNALAFVLILCVIGSAWVDGSM